MPAILERLVRQLAGKRVKNAYAVATSQLQKRGILKKGTNSQLTEKGKKRNSMTPAQRAKDRASKYSNRKNKITDYNYNPRTNRATLKKNKKK